MDPSREADLVRIYIPESLYKLFTELNKANEIIVKQIDAGIDTCQVIYPNNIRPTRKNVLDLNYLNIRHTCKSMGLKFAEMS